MIYYGYKNDNKIVNACCYETIENVPQAILDSWQEITEQEYDATIEMYAQAEQDEQPTQLDRIEAQLMYTALLTDTLIEE